MIRNFLFHRVNPERDALWDPMDVKLFEKCIKHIANHYETTQIEHLSNIDSNNEKIATISFDDGYADNSAVVSVLTDDIFMSQHR